MSSEDFPQFWEDIYKKNDTGWDLGGPTPIFKKLVQNLNLNGSVLLVVEEDMML